MYYEHPEIGNSEIEKLFGKRSSNTMSKLKKLVKDEMNSRGVASYNANAVNTKIAYEVWGLDITDLAERYRKLEELRNGRLTGQ
ncbi:MAG: hypothetical protein FWB93_05170 [Oscillospiraceae bacterium]|nr:hypothetical protein [Oscillospiraceae bacterium]